MSGLAALLVATYFSGVLVLGVGGLVYAAEGKAEITSKHMAFGIPSVLFWPLALLVFWVYHVRKALIEAQEANEESP